MLNRLFLSGNRKSKESDVQRGGKQPDWMRFAVIAFLVYAGVKVYNQSQQDSVAQADTKQLSRREERQLQQEAQLKQQMDMIKQQSELMQKQVAAVNNPPVAAAPLPATIAVGNMGVLPPYMQIGGEIEGQGDGAECGQRATVKVDALLPDGTALEGYDVNAPARMTTVGNAALPWAAGLRGMKLGGVRQLVIPASYVTDEPTRKAKNIAADAKVRFKLQLDKVEPVAVPNGLAFQALDLVQGTGDAVACGQRVKAQVHVWAQDGTAATTKPYDVSFAVGSVPYFYGLDRGLVDMKLGGKRRLIVPPVYLKGASDNAATPATNSAEKPLMDVIAGGHTVVLDVNLISVEKAPQ